MSDAPTTTSAARVAAINVSNGGVPKRSITAAEVTVDGIRGDRHRFKYHGGPDRALVLYSLEVIEALQAEGHPIAVGTVGENVTVQGLDWARLTPGTVLEIGEVRARVTKYATPCKTISDSFRDGDSMRISQQEHPGWSRVCCRVLAEGRIAVGDQVEIADRGSLIADR